MKLGVTAGEKKRIKVDDEVYNKCRNAKKTVQKCKPMDYEQRMRMLQLQIPVLIIALWIFSKL
jgi:hypothetical protein